MKELFKKGNFARKLLFIFLFLISVPTILLSFLEFYYSKTILEEKTNDYLKNLASVTMSKIESTVATIEDVAFYINGNDSIQASLKEEQNVINDRQAYYNLFRDIREVLTFYALFNQEINAINIYSEHGKEYAYSKVRSGKLFDITEYIQDENQYWLVDDDKIMLIKRLYAYPTKEQLGYVTLDVNEKSLYNIIADIDYSKSGKVFLVDERGNIITTEDTSLLGQPLSEELMKCFTEQESFHEDVVIDEMHYSIYNSDEISNGWNILLAIPRDYFIQDIVNLQNTVAWITIIMACITAFVSVIISRSVTKPLQNLSNAMEEFGQGNFEINCAVDSEDEIGRLSQTFNQMVTDMNSLVNTVYEQKVMKQEAQMKSLQMQINPHFLYNTLDTINWMARMKKADEVGDMAAALGNMMRYSLSKKSFAMIQDEIKNINDYLSIQNLRYGDKMETKIEVDDSLLNIYIPKLLIQPILENAIVHGIEEKIDKGRITILAWQKEEHLYIQVEDDGVGMTEEAITHILNGEYSTKKRDHSSIGIVNVNRRIQMIYGSNYGLQIQSVLGAGTKMTLHMRVLMKEPENLIDSISY